MNLAERFIEDLTEECLRPGSSASIAQLTR